MRVRVQSVAILQSGVDRVAVWDVATRAVMYVDTGLKDPSFLKWSRVGPQLVIGSAKGGVVIFRKDSRKKLPITGKHSGAITCGDWSRDNRLALGGADNAITVSNADGDTIEQLSVKQTPVALQFATQKTDSRPRRGGAGAAATDAADTTVSANLGGRTIMLYDVTDAEHPMELAFEPRYGRIITYKWFGDGYLMIGFSEGWLVVVSTHVREMGQELYSGRFHREALEDIAYNLSAQRAATAGGNDIRLLDMVGWKEAKGESASVPPAHGPIDSLSWTADGQIITAATRSGHVYSFLARMPTIVDSWGSRVAYMSSLREVTVVDAADDTPPVQFPVNVEPAFVALGAAHAAVGMNNRVWFHRVTGTAGIGAVVAERDYLGTVDDVKLGAAHAAVLCQGRIFVHRVEAPAATGQRGAPPPPDAGMRTLPEGDGAPAATCIAIADDYLVYGTTAGTVCMFNLADWAPIPACDFRSDSGRSIRGVFPNESCTRIAILNDAQQGNACCARSTLGKPQRCLRLNAIRRPQDAQKLAHSPSSVVAVSLSSALRAPAFIV